MYDKRSSKDAKSDREFTLGNSRNMSRRVICDQSVAEETHSAPGVRSQARRGQPEIGLRFTPLPTKMCVLVYTDSVVHNADADADEKRSDDEWLAKAKQKGIRVRSQHGVLVCVGLRAVWRKLKPFQHLS